MDADRIKGRAREFSGTAEETWGRAVGDDATVARGLADQVAGASQATLGQAKDNLRDQADRAAAYAEEAYDRGRRAAEEGARVLNERIEANPAIAILIAGGLGYLVGIMARRGRR